MNQLVNQSNHVNQSNQCQSTRVEFSSSSLATSASLLSKCFQLDHEHQSYQWNQSCSLCICRGKKLVEDKKRTTCDPMCFHLLFSSSCQWDDHKTHSVVVPSRRPTMMHH